LRWALHENSGRPELEGAGNLPKPWASSFARAIKRLEEQGFIQIQKRHLKDFRECVTHYPGKTLQGDIRCLRQRLLPVLLEWSEQSGGVFPRYNQSDNELYQLNLLDADQVEKLRSIWSKLEPCLRERYGQSGEGADQLLRLICKVRNLLLGNSDITVNRSLAQVVDEVCRNRLVDEDMQGQLRSLYQQFMPEEKASELRFVSLIHRFTQVPNQGQCCLRDDTLEYLLKKDAKFIEEMEGFRREAGRIGPRRIPQLKVCEYPDRLKRLFDQTVFQEFHFISLAS